MTFVNFEYKSLSRLHCLDFIVDLGEFGTSRKNVYGFSALAFGLATCPGRSVGVSDRSFEELVGRSVGIYRVGLLFQNEGRSVGKPESGVLRGHGSVGRTGKNAGTIFQARKRISHVSLNK